MPHNALKARQRDAKCIFRVTALALAAATGIAGCSSFGSHKPAETAAPVDPNAYPANYQNQVVSLLRTTLTDRGAFQNAMISPPVLKQVGGTQHYVVCMRLGGRIPRDKVAIYLAGSITQFLNATPELCGDAAYQPFPELAAATPE